MNIAIYDDRMLEIALNHRNRFQQQAERCNEPAPDGVHPVLWKANCDSARSIVEEFDAEIVRYRENGPAMM